MKIIGNCVCIFLFCISSRTSGVSLFVAAAEDTSVVSTFMKTSIESSKNNTVDLNLNSVTKFNEQSVINDDNVLEPSADIYSSIEDIPSEVIQDGQKPEQVVVEAVSQNSGVTNDFTGSTPGIIQVVDSAALELKEKAEEMSSALSSQNYNETSTSNLTKQKSIATESSQALGKNISLEINLEQRSDHKIILQNEIETEPVPSSEPKKNITEQEPQEEIPSFSEWAQKQLEEAEKKKEPVNSSQSQNGKSTSKKRWKNYASPDCGAKIIAANPEAVSPGSVLSASRDEYKLNTCTSRIWFIVELCEAIQAKKIDLANFELFSSSPKEFNIYVSDRFPTRDWSSVGHFVAKDERDVQSFDLHPHLFGKYIKFEMHSHHGSEHYCPISLFRVYGTSEFEVLETENQVHTNQGEEDEDEETLDLDTGQPPKNLFSSAKDAVISIVKKAAEVLGNKGNTSGIKDQQNDIAVHYTPLISTCTTPSHIVVCDNCSDLVFGKVFELLSCKSRQLEQLVLNQLIKNTLYHSKICIDFGLNFDSKSKSTTSALTRSYISSIFSPVYLGALCNTIAVNECKVVLNISNSNATISQDIEKIISTKVFIISDANDLSTKSSSEIVQSPPTNNSEISQIKPTKTLSEDYLNLTEVSLIEVQESSVHPTLIQVQNDTKIVKEDLSHPMEQGELSAEVVDVESSTENPELLDEHLDSLTDFNMESNTNTAASTASPPTAPQGQKESVFLRLSNRIKVLERNMSLSSQYLEELSRRYKKQVEELQKLLDKTITTLKEENQKKEERTQYLEEKVVTLQELLDNLITEKNSWIYITYWIFLCGVVMLSTMLFCRRNPEFKQSCTENQSTTNEIQRRKSIDVISHKNPTTKKRRPSEEALVSGTYSHLMIDEVDKSLKNKKRKKKKLLRSNSITTLNEEIDDRSIRTINSDKGFTFNPTSSSAWRRQESAPHTLSQHWLEDSVVNKIRDIPFVLEESEHSTLEPLTYVPVIHQKHIKSNGNTHTETFATATETRTKRLFGKKSANGKNKLSHMKSASFDETTRHKVPSSVIASSLDNSFDESLQVGEATKERKKGVLKKIFKFNFK